jgi:zinc-ribbon domain
MRGEKAPVDTCSHCGGELPQEATFCPSCGRRTDAPPPDPTELIPHTPRSEPRYYGLAKPLFVLLIVLVLIVSGIVVLATASVGVGLILIILGVCLLPSLVAGLQRWPDTRLARASLQTAGRVRNEADVAVQSLSSLSRAGRDVVRLRRQQFQLRRERDAKIRELGVAAYQEDAREDELRKAAKELDRQIESNERTIQRAVSRARTRVRKERATVAKTEVIEPESPTVEDARPKPRKKAS